MTAEPAAPLRLSAADARRALWRYHFAPGDVDAVARRLGSIQYDPLAPVGRNPDLVLQARVPGYRVDDWQAAAYGRRTLVDAWDKMVCLTLVEDWPARHLFHDDFERRWGRRVFEPHPDVVAETLGEVRERGPLETLSFRDGRVRGDLAGSWYGPKLTKHVLRALWDTGRIVTHDRVQGRHVYDLPERSLPAAAVGAPRLPRDAAIRRLILRRVQAAGMLRPTAGSAVWFLPAPRDEVAAARAALVAEGALHEVSVDGARFVAVPEAVRALDDPGPGRGIRFVAPLDGLMWDRGGVRHLYGFDYVWEVYKPAAARRWGYYVLPVLWEDRFVARVDARLRAGTLEVLAWHWEEPFGAAPVGAPLSDDLVAGAAAFMGYLGADRVRLARGTGRAARSVWAEAARIVRSGGGA